MSGWNQFYLFYFLYRCTFSVLGDVVVRAYTKLGDAATYQTDSARFGPGWMLDSTSITVNIGTVFRTLFLGNGILVHIGFQAIAFFGLYRLLKALDPPLRRRLALLLLLPSFNLWTSIASKEAVLVFAICLIGEFIVNSYRNDLKFKVVYFLCFYIIFVFKPHYALSLLYVVGVTLLAMRLRQRAFVAMLVGGLSIVPMYIFREKLSELSFSIIPHFVGYGHSTRGIFWVEQYDVFLRAPYGMFISFFGPTFSEAFDARHILQIFSFVESSILVAVLGFFLLRRLPELPAYNIIVAVFATFWMLFPNYPFGVMNPGSAVRYRSGYLVFIFLIVVLMFSRQVYVDWRMGRRGRDGPTAASLAPTAG